MRKLLGCCTFALLLAACGGSGVPSDPTRAPQLVLEAPDEGALLAGDFTVIVRAVGDHVDIETLAFSFPAQLAGTAPVFDKAAHTATIVGSARTSSFEDGTLTVTANTVDVNGKSAQGTWTFQVSSTAKFVTIDSGFASYRDEQGVQLATTGGIATMPMGFVYASESDVAVGPGSTLHKVVSRMGWSGAAPSAAELEGANTFNIPVARLLLDHQSTEPALVSATATVKVGAMGTPVTVNLIPASTSPAGQRAYLLPFASNLIPDLASLEAATAVTVTARIDDAVGHVFTGGPWAVTMVPLAPPVAVLVDAEYPSSLADPRSAWPYRLANADTSTYAQLWTGDFSLDAGARVLHVTITNSDAALVAIGAALDGGSWTLTESWVANDGNQVPYGPFTESCGPGGCSGSQGPCNPLAPNSVHLQPVGSAIWACSAASYRDGPAPTQVTRAGALHVTGYKDGTSTPADRVGERFLVPAASGGSPGRLDLYAVRPATSDRTGELPLTWIADRNRYEAGTSFRTRHMASKTSNGSCGTSCVINVYNWAEIAWSWRLASAVETITGTLALDARAYGAAEYGPTGAAAPSATLPAAITH